MRRILASALIAVLVASLSLPAWATACAHMATTPMCHRAPAQQHHHCDSMMDDADEAVASSSNQTVSDLPVKCPMRCCMQATASKVAAAVKSNIGFQPVTSAELVEFPTILFISNGFSSHTDRGPPIA